MIIYPFLYIIKNVFNFVYAYIQTAFCNANFHFIKLIKFNEKIIY